MNIYETKTDYKAPDIAAALIQNGYMPVPIPHGQKGPRIPNWQNRTFTVADFRDDNNIGIRCGDLPIALLDIDIYCDTIVSSIVTEWSKRFGNRGSHMQRTGEAPKTGIPFRTEIGLAKTSQAVHSTGEAPLDAKGNPKIEKVEVLSNGQQFVAYGIHPNTQKPYRWHGLNPADLNEGGAEALPYVTTHEVAEFLSWVKQEFAPETSTLPLSEQPALKTNSLSGGLSTVEAFNSTHSLTDLMQKYGYQHRYNNHWTSPNSTTGSANVEVLSERWRSLSGSDAATGVGAETKGGIRSGDAFDLYVAFEHAGDFAAALRSYSGEVSIEVPNSTDANAPISTDEKIPRNFEDLFSAAENLKTTDIEQMEDIVSECSHLPPIRREQIFSKIREVTGVTLTTLRQQVAHDRDIDELDHLDIARMALDCIGRDNILFASAYFWLWKKHGVWAQQDDRAIQQAIQARMDNENGLDVYASLVKGVCDVMKSEMYKPEHAFNLGNPETVNCLNGELELSEDYGWNLRPHDREHYRTTQIPVEFGAHASAPMFANFLDGIFRDDFDKAEKIKATLELMGYSLMSHARHERFVMLIGPGANGKSVLLAVLEGLLGANNVAGVQPANFDRSFQRAHLHQKLANIVTELKQGEVIADAELKAITSGEPATVEHKHRDPFVMRPYATCWFGTNHMPHTKDFSEALFRRTTILQFNRVFQKEEQDPLLKEKLLTELPGILNMALFAYERALKEGFSEPTSSEAAKNEWRLEADQVAQFVEDICLKQANERVPTGEVFRAYVEWAGQNSVRQTVSHKVLRDRLERLGFGSQKSGSTRYVTGMRLS